MPELAAPGKPRRFWLFFPFALVALAVAALCLWWVYLDRQLEAGLDRLAAGQGSLHASYSARRIEGFPFRLEVLLSDPNFSEPSGWGLTAPRLEAVASVFDPSHAVILAPQGVVLSRPTKGAVAINGPVLRASAGGFGGRVRFDVEAKSITIQPKPGGIAMPFSAVDNFEMHLRPEGGDQDRLVFQMDGATATADSPMARVTDGKSNLQLEATISQAHALTGRDWPSILRAWQSAGGVFTVVKSQATVGQAVLSADGSALGVEPDGRLHGKLDLHLKEGPAAMMALGASGVLPPDTAAVGAGLAPREAHVALKFRGGETMVGPISIGKAPRLY